MAMFRLLVVLVAMFFVPIAPAHAYLDPGTGSIILQGLIAAVTATAVTLGVYWQRIKGFFTTRSSTREEPDQDLDEGPSER